MKNNKQKPTFHDISMMPAIAEAIDGMVESDKGQFDSMLAAQHKPWVLDDYTVNKVITVYNERLEYVELFDRQLSIWSDNPSNKGKLLEVDRLKRQVDVLRQNAINILSLAADLNKGTINRIMETDVEVLGAATVMAAMKKKR